MKFHIEVPLLLLVLTQVLNAATVAPKPVPEAPKPAPEAPKPAPEAPKPAPAPVEAKPIAPKPAEPQPVKPTAAPKVATPAAGNGQPTPSQIAEEQKLLVLAAEMPYAQLEKLVTVLSSEYSYSSSVLSSVVQEKKPTSPIPETAPTKAAAPTKATAPEVKPTEATKNTKSTKPTPETKATPETKPTAPKPVPNK